jgi:hypothetical protein
MVAKLSDLSRLLWLRAKLGAPPLMQKAVISPLLARKETLRLVLNPFLQAYRLAGQNQAGSLAATYIGTESSVWYLRKNLFGEGSTKIRVGRVSAWQIDKMTALPDSDILIVEAGKWLVDKLPQQKAIVIPSYVHLLLDVQGPWEEVESHLRRRKSARSEMRLVHKYGYEYEISHREDDFQTFYRDMYLPSVKPRHKEFASPMSKELAYQHFRNGLLFLVKRNGQCVCGNLCRVQQKTLFLVLGGILNADERLMKEGALGATDYLNIRWASQNGFETVNFLVTEPFLGSGVFQYKRKWGSRVAIPSNEKKRIWLKVRRLTPAVAQFLKDNPAIVLGENDTLQGLIVTDDPASVSAEDKEEWQKKYATPGLDSLLIRSVADFIDVQELDEAKL